MMRSARTVHQGRSAAPPRPPAGRFPAQTRSPASLAGVSGHVPASHRVAQWRRAEARPPAWSSASGSLSSSATLRCRLWSIVAIARPKPSATTRSSPSLRSVVSHRLRRRCGTQQAGNGEAEQCRPQPDCVLSTSATARTSHRAFQDKDSIGALRATWRTEDTTISMTVQGMQ